ncbi:MAG TPA: hypothetical protein EYO08_00505 [Candidatus Marinimicrobia bacterium]|nr:hypothetical protein [Candidatus Neomarinimicrobiota bacterium]
MTRKYRPSLIVVCFSIVCICCEKESTTADEENVIPQPQEFIALTDFRQAETCRPCHPVHYEEWKSSMHAYAMKDPVFHSGWEEEQAHRPETGEQFCIQCHNPYSYVSGSEVDTANALISEGIGCDLCHSMVAVHDQVVTADNVAASAEYFLNVESGMKFGQITDPVDNGFHGSMGLSMFNSSSMCLPCHNLNIRELDAEITFTEWAGSGFAAMSIECQTCHMADYQGYAADPAANPGVPVRTVHHHSMVGVDLDLSKSLTDNPQGEAVVAMLQSAADLDVTGTPTVDNDTLHLSLTIQNLTGHSFPSGVSFARELWLELQVFDGSQVYFSSGLLDSHSSDLSSDVEIFNSVLYDANGNSVVSVTDVINMSNNSLQTNEARVKTFSAPVAMAEDSVSVTARLLFRPFAPSKLRGDHQDLLLNLPVITVDSLSITVPIP